MSRVAYLGGFGSGRRSTEKVGKALEKYYENVDVFTFSDQVIYPDKIRKATKNIDLVTHSAGALALSELEINPDYAYLLNPPVPRRIIGLIGRSALKTGRMYTPGLGLHSLEDLSSARDYSESSIAELLVHPIANLSRLPSISNFDAVEVAINAKKAGVNSRLVWTTHDSYFRPSLGDFIDASKNSITIDMLHGEHDEVVLRPGKFLEEVFNKSN